jgi:hypothetical protein
MTETAQKVISREELVGMMQRLSTYEKILENVMHCPTQDLPQLQKKIIAAGIKMGLEFHGTQEHSYEEEQVYGKIKITGKYTNKDGIRYNIAMLDDDGEVIRSSMRQCLDEEQLTQLINNNQPE